MTITFLAPIEAVGRPRLALPQVEALSLSERDREIVALAATTTYAAVAQRVGVTRSAVSGVMHRVRNARPEPMDRASIEMRNLAEGLARRPSLYLDVPAPRATGGEG